MVTKNEIIKNIYKYYPKNLDAIIQNIKYIESIEYLNLLKKISNRKSSKYQNIVYYLENKYDNVKEISSSSFIDRSLNIQIELVKGSINEFMFVNISLLEPLYTIFILEVKVENNFWKELPKRNKSLEQDKYAEIITEISIYIEKEYLLYKIPENYLFDIVNDISFQDIEFNNFTIFNAYFINNYTLIL